MSLLPASIKRLQTVHPDLQRVILRASELYNGSFVVTEGERPLAKQKALVAKGASMTMRSRHVAEMNESGVACAVDLAVWLDYDDDGIPEDGEIRWDGNLYVDLAHVVQEAAEIEGIDVVWGGNWSSLLHSDIVAAQAEYIRRKRAKGQRPFIDGPHFELNWEVYP